MWCKIWFEQEVELAWRMASSKRRASLRTQQFRSAFIVNQNIPKLDYYHCLVLGRHVSNIKTNFDRGLMGLQTSSSFHNSARATNAVM